MREKIIDDLAGMMGGAAGLLADIRDQVRTDMRDRMKGVADRIDLVTREELMALSDRVAMLEALLKKQAAPAKQPAPKTTVKKAAAKKAAAKKTTKKGAGKGKR